MTAINRHSAADLAALMTEDHLFIDPLGSRVQGRDKMTAGWAGYFRMVPDYNITVDESYSAGATVVMLGTARGAYAGNEPMRAIMRRSSTH